MMMKKGSKGEAHHHMNGTCGICCGWDFFDKLMLIAIGILLLLINMGVLSAALLAYWPIVLVLWGLKGFLDE